MSDAWLIVGLGNPGPQYAKTRHNIGQMVLDELAREVGGTFKKHPKASAVVATGRLGMGGPKVVLMKSLGYMNVSGGPVSAVAKFYGIEPDHVVVVHDELDIPFDTIKLKRGGGEGGHNGLRDIHAQLGSGDYWRLRLGIGHPGHKAEVAAWVLRKPPLDERIGIEQAMDRAAQAFPLLAAEDMAQATQIIHTSKPPRPKPPRKPQQAAPAPDVSE